MNNIWKYISIFFAGMISAIFFWEQTQKPNEVTNISNNTKIKAKQSEIKDVEVKTDVIQQKIKKRFRLFKKRKNN